MKWKQQVLRFRNFIKRKRKRNNNNKIKVKKMK